MKKDSKALKIIKRTAVILSVFIVLNIAAVPIVYECIFAGRFDTEDFREYEVSDFEGLEMVRSDFNGDGENLAGYMYSKDVTDGVKGVVIVCHGYGGGGHNTYMPFIDVFTSNGYCVFSYDARANDNSSGKSVGGLPQGISDLDSAIHHINSIEEYKGLPIVLFGHSWGAYSAASVLYMHPEIKAAALMAGFNESEDLLYHRSSLAVGSVAKLLIPCLELYERIKFGKELSDISAIEGLEKTDAGILIAHSKDDTVVPTEYGYDKFFELFGENERFEFVLYEDKGHDYVFYSEEAAEYRDKLNEDYAEYVEAHGGKYNGEIKAEFMEKYLDKKKCFEPDEKLMNKIIEIYDRYCID